MRLSRKWIAPFARAGYAARGMVYAIVGFFAVLASIGAGEEKNAEAALRTILEQPFGAVLLWIMVVCLAGYVFWRLLQSLADTDDHGFSPKGLAIRLGLLASAFTYAALMAYALSLLNQLSGNSTGSDAVTSAIDGIIGQKYTALGYGTVLAGVAGAHWWKAATRKYRRHFQASEHTMIFIDIVSIVGLAARGFVFAVIALLLYRYAAGNVGEGREPGLTEVMHFLQQLPYGQLLFVALGIGLLGFSAYSFSQAMWRRINVGDTCSDDQDRH